MKPPSITTARLTSLCEELEAIDWYDQRVRATSDESLAAVLAYNRDDEKEHAAMALEWLRRRDVALDANLRKFLFTSGPITEIGDGAARRRISRRLRALVGCLGVPQHRQPQGDGAMNHLHRDLAPISDEGWEVIDQEAKSRLPTYLAARKLVDFGGPHGWSHSATNLGRISPISGPSEGVSAAQRMVLPLVELRTEFKVSRVQLDDVERGADRSRPRRTR